MEENATIITLLETLRRHSPSGFAIALHIKYSAPKYLFQAYPKDWVDYYSKNGLVLQDPTVVWGFENVGSIRWADLAAKDTAGVLSRAADFGLLHGLTIAENAQHSRSIASFARPDREYSDAEIAEMEALVKQLHATTLSAETLSPDDHEALRRMSIYLTHA